MGAAKKKDTPKTASELEREGRERGAQQLGRALDNAEKVRESVGERRRKRGATGVLMDEFPK